jgi:hypothetical protein
MFGVRCDKRCQFSGVDKICVCRVLEVIPEVTLEVIPEVTLEVIPEATLEVIPEATQGVIPGVTREVQVLVMVNLL